jgi:ribonucleoside-diphosphate reductase alpha chain
VLEEYLQFRQEQPTGVGTTSVGTPTNGRHADEPLPLHSESMIPEQPLLKIGDLCPECGQAAVVNEEGCRKCYACGFSEC